MAKTRQNTLENLRRSRRYHTRVTGRYIASGADVSCTVLDVSAGGAKLKADIIAAPGDAMALSIPQIGFMRGAVRRIEGDLICVAFDASPEKTSALSDRIAKYFAAASAPERQENKS